MGNKATWLEVYKKNGEWKIANGRTGQVLLTAGTKAQAVSGARNYLGSGGKYTYISAQIYHSGSKNAEQIVSRDAVDQWTRTKARMR